MQCYLRIVNRLRDRVQIAAGLDHEGNLAPEAQARGLQCLREFGEQLRSLPHEQVRAVGTNTFRKARNSEQLLAAAEEALGHPIEIISGQEEARLIYGGVASELPSDKGRSLVFYCHSPFCSAAADAARRALAAGHAYVFVMPAGIKGWVEAGLPVVRPGASG